MISKTVLLASFTLGTVVALPSLQSRQSSICPYSLPDGAYEFPHLIVPVNNSNVPLGHSYFATVTPNNCATIFNFDIPPSRANGQCSLYFTFPRHDQLTTSDFTWHGTNSSAEASGSLQLVQYAYNTGATDATTGNSQPPLGPDPTINLSGVVPGNSYKVWSGNCGGGGVMSWRLSSSDSSLTYFQDWNACAIGLWVVYEGAPSASGPGCGHCPSESSFESHAAWLEAYVGQPSQLFHEYARGEN